MHIDMHIINIHAYINTYVHLHEYKCIHIHINASIPERKKCGHGPQKMGAGPPLPSPGTLGTP